MSDLARLTNDTLRQQLEANSAMRGIVSASDMIHAWLQPGAATTGLQNYDLQKPALSMVPVPTPIRNRMPRVGAKGGIQANWKTITGINSTNVRAVLSQGSRGSVPSFTEVDYLAAYVGVGLDDYVTYEAEYAAEEFMDLYSRAQTQLLWNVMIAEEKLIVGGLGTYALGQANQPSLSDVTASGGTIPANTTVSVYVAPLSMDGYLGASVAGGVQGLMSQETITGRTVQFGGGTGQMSANRQVITANDGNNAHTINATTAALKGAVAYAWFWGAAGAEVLGAITTINSLVISTAAGTGTQTAASLGANDNSQNTSAFDGIISQVCKAGAGGYVATQATGTAGTGTPLTADGYGQVVELDTALEYFYDNYRASPSRIIVASQEAKNITKKMLQGGNNTAQRFVIQSSGNGITGGMFARSYYNKFAPGGPKELDIEIHPYLPPGTLIFDTDSVPYPLSGVTNLKQMRLRVDYYARLWPEIERRKEFGCYFDGVMQNYFVPMHGIITNIGNG